MQPVVMTNTAITCLSLLLDSFGSNSESSLYQTWQATNLKLDNKVTEALSKVQFSLQQSSRRGVPIKVKYLKTRQSTE